MHILSSQITNYDTGFNEPSGDKSAS